ncbi:MAG: nucleotidyltransferase family protein [Lawsonibacter sp.]
MPAAGIVAEYNPFHTGHAYQIARTRQVLGQEAAVVAVMSGNWVQQADCAIADKWTRARLAVMGGVDLVLELPTVWAMSSAESFARGAVSILNDTGVVDVLSFGSECGETEPLREAADCLDSEEYRAGLSRFLGEGMSFAAARQAAVGEILGCKAKLLSSPNNNLGIEYIRALNAMGNSIRPMTVLRRGAAHNSVSVISAGQDEKTVCSGQAAADRPQFVSATQIRQDLLEGRWSHAEPYLVCGGRELLEGRMIGLPELRRVERAVLTRLRTMTAADWAELPDSGAAEGLPRRLEQAGWQCTSVEEFFELAKTKRYTHARLRRLVLWAFLGLRQTDVPNRPPYLRVLGFNERGRELLRQMRDRASLPILTKPAHARELDQTGRRLFELEARCTDLYHLCFESVPVPGQEWTTGPVILS